jgi:hypothetical protein
VVASDADDVGRSYWFATCGKISCTRADEVGAGLPIFNLQLVEISANGGIEAFYQGLPSVAGPRVDPYDVPLSPGIPIGTTLTLGM